MTPTKSTSDGRAPSPGARLRVVAYLRVSTDKQAEQGLGLDVQEHAIRTWAKAGGYRILGWTRDEGISGSNGIDSRIGLYDAMAMVRDRQVAGIVVYRLDRLARDLVLQESLLADIRRMGGELFSTSPAEAGYLTDDPDDPSRALIRQVLGAVSQYERSMIRLRMRSGKARKKEKGGFAGGGVPFGQRAEGRELVEDASERAVVARILELHAAGSSLRQIAATLTAEGHKPKRSKSGTWHPYAIAKIIKRLAES